MPRKKAKAKVLRMYCAGFPETREEMDKFYRIMEKTGTFRQLFDGRRIVATRVSKDG